MEMAQTDWSATATENVAIVVLAIVYVSVAVARQA